MNTDYPGNGMLMAEHVYECLIPEILLENSNRVETIGFLVTSSVMSPIHDISSQIKHLKMPIELWDAEKVNLWGRSSSDTLIKVIEQFESGVPIKELNLHFPLNSIAMTLAWTRNELEAQFDRLFKIHSGEVSFYDYVAHNEAMLVCTIFPASYTLVDP